MQTNLFLPLNKNCTENLLKWWRFSHQSNTKLLIRRLLEDLLPSSYPILIISIWPKTQLLVKSTLRNSVVLAWCRLESRTVICSFCKKRGLCRAFWCALPKHLIQHSPKLTWLSCCEIPWYHLMTLFKQGIFVTWRHVTKWYSVRESMCAPVIEGPLWHSFLVLINCITN